MCNRYKSGGIDSEAISCLAEQRGFKQKLENDRKSGAVDRVDDEKENRDFEGMVTAQDVVIFGNRSKMREVQHVKLILS